MGSGGHNSKGRLVAQAAMRLDIRELRRRGCLIAGRHGSIEWAWHDGSKSSVAFKSELHAINLAYTWTDRWSGQTFSVSERVDLDWSPCRFGGRRAYFLCPGCPYCAEVLFLRGGRFRCRAGARVAYASQNERTMARAQRRQRKLILRLGDGTSPVAIIPEKPKGMWRRTYDQLIVQIVAAEREIDAAFNLSVARLRRRLAPP
jgi:hypothetical protein